MRMPREAIRAPLCREARSHQSLRLSVHPEDTGAAKARTMTEAIRTTVQFGFPAPIATKTGELSLGKRSKLKRKVDQGR